MALNTEKDAKEKVQNNRTVLNRIFKITSTNYFDEYFAQNPAEKICSKNNKVAK